MDLHKIAKVLALAASDNDAEALHALRTARRLLEAQGADFIELARRLGEASGVGRKVLEDTIFDLRNEIRQLRADNERLKQGGVTPVATEPVNIFDAARATADAIRLRAELTEVVQILEQERAQAAADQTALHAALNDALTQAAAAAARLSEADTRRMRLEVENRRLSHANHALTVELDEAKAQKPAFAVALLEADPAHDKKSRGGVRGRDKTGANQYALF